MSTPDDLLAARESWQLDLATSESLRVRVGGLSSELAVANAEIARLQAIIDGPSPTLVGSSAGYMTWDALTAKTGPLAIRRSYEDTIPSDFMAKSTGADVGRNASLTSIKTGVTAANASGAANIALSRYLSTVPTGHPVYLAVHHEPEDTDPVMFADLQRQVRSVIDAENTGRAVPLSFGGIFMAQSAGNAAAEAYHPGDGIWDFVGWDGYSRKVGARTPAEVFEACVTFNDGAPFLIAECGTPRPDPERPAWITDVVGYARNAGALAVCWWNQRFSGKPDYRLVEQADFDALKEASSSG